jgi:thioredoxin reductase
MADPAGDDAFDLDVAVIGGGPAALAFADAVAGAGLAVRLFDEQPRPGGQVLRQPPGTFRLEAWPPGQVDRALKRLLVRFEGQAEVAWAGGAPVLGIGATSGGFEIAVASGGSLVRRRARRVLIATGCQDLPAPFPGWTLPGVMTAGAVQTLLKAQGLLAGARIAFCGTHPLQLIVADQVVAAGGGVAAVVFAQPLSAVLGLARHPAAAVTHAGVLVQAAMALARLRRAGVPVRFGETPLRALGKDAVEAADLQPTRPPPQGPAGAGEAGPRARLDCDALALCFGFTPQSDLARGAGADYVWDEPYGGWRVRHDRWMRASIGGLYVAGEAAGVGGARKAAVEGALAGLAVLADAGLITPADARRRAERLWGARRRVMRFARLLRELTTPAAALARMADPAAMVCRCESVSGSDLAAALASHVRIGRPSALKLLTRAGMGPCGGRNCEVALVRLVAGARGRAPEPADAFTPRFPARATAIADLIGA